MGDVSTAVSDEIGENALRTVGNADETLARLANRDFTRLRKLNDLVDDSKMKIALNLLILKSLYRIKYVTSDDEK